MTGTDGQTHPETGGVARAEALAERITRLTNLVASRTDNTSRQLRQHLDVLSSTLRQRASAAGGPAWTPAGSHEVVVAIPPELDLIEALVTGAPLGRGETGPQVETASRLARAERAASDVPVATDDILDVPGPDAASEDETSVPLEAAPEATAPESAAEPEPINAEAAEEVAGEADAEPAEAAPAAEPEKLEVAEPAGELASDSSPSEAPAPVEAAGAASEVEASEPELVEGAASEEGAETLPAEAELTATSEASAPAAQAAADVDVPAEDGAETSAEGAPSVEALAESGEASSPIVEADDEAGVEAASDQGGTPVETAPAEAQAPEAVSDSEPLDEDATEVLEAVGPALGARDELAELDPDATLEHPSPVAAAEDETVEAWAPVSVDLPFGADVNPSRELEVPEAVQLALEEEALAASSFDEEGTPSFDEPHAQIPPPPDESAEDAIQLATQDVLTTVESDQLDAARDEARHVLASLGAKPGEKVPDPEGIEPLERLARQSTSSRRPQPRAVAVLPRHLAYEALAAPLRLNPDGGLVCLVPEEYEPERLHRLASALERRVVAVEGPHEEVMAALEAAYGPVGGVDQDALLIAISDDSSGRPRGFMGRMSRWLRNT